MIVSHCALIPFVKWQTYRGVYKAAANSPRVSVDELEVGIEYQIMKALELTLAYSTMDRTNVRASTSSSSSFLGQASGDMLRMQVQWNY
jgi:predicted porin